ncbi:hypothetical protein [Dysgonomonas reticulitermitis]
MKKYFYIVILLINSMSLIAQNLSDAYKINEQNIIMPSPQSFIFEKYVNQPVNEYNGIPQISIPLGELKIKGLTIPITLSYHASGVKFMQFDGDLGAGWSINVGGYRISRTINSRSDFEDAPYYDAYYFWENLLRDPKPLNIDEYLGSLYQRRGQHSYIASWNTPADGEKDLFTFNIPTSSGHFLYKSGYILEKTFEKAIISPTGGSIVDTQGNIFYFGGYNNNNTKPIESTVINNETHPTAWLLSKLVTPFNDSITFGYKPYIQYSGRYAGEFQSINVSDAAAIAYSGVGERNHESESITTSSSIRPSRDQWNYFLTESFYLDNIEAPNMTIVINRIDDKNPSLMNRPGSNKNSPCLVDNIQILSKNGEILKTIYFSYKTSPETVESEHLPWHHLLRAVIIQTTNSLKEEYKFLYNEPQGNVQTGYYPDQWGFYKKGGGSDVILHKEFADEKVVYSFTSRTNYLPPTIKKLREFNHSGQEWSFVDRKSNSNPQIFSLRTIIYPTGGYREFEYEPNRFNGIVGGGMRIKSIKTYDGLKRPEIVAYKYSDGIPNLNIDENNFKSMSFNFSLIGRFFYSCTKTYSMNPTGNVPMHDFSVNYPEVSIRKASLNGIDTIYEGKTIMKFLIPEKYKTSPMVGAPHTTSSHPVSMSNLPVSEPYSANSTINVLEYALGYSPQLQTKEIWNKDNKLIFQEGFTYKDVGYPNSVLDHYDYSEMKVRQVVNFDYHFPNDPPCEAAYWVFTRYQFPDLLSEQSCGSTFNYNNAYSFILSLYSYMFYRIQEGRLLPETKTVVQYDKDGLNPVTMKETYMYDGRNRLSKTTQTNSTNNYLEKEYTYPSPVSALHKKNMLSTIIETITKHNDKEIGRIRNNYGSIFPSSIQTSTSDPGKVRLDIIFNKYDQKGNILHYTTIDGLNTIYLWGYNGQYPIAEIKGGSYSDVETAAKSVFSVASIETLSNMLVPPETKLKDGSLQKALPSAIVSTYTYKSPIGLVTVTDPTGITTYYNIDNAGRLLNVKDHKSKLISEYSYIHKQSDSNPERVDIKPMILSVNNPHIHINDLTISQNNTSGTYSYSWSILDASNNIVGSGNTAKIIHNFVPGKHIIDYSITDQEFGYKFYNSEEFNVMSLSGSWGQKPTTDFSTQLIFTAGSSGGSGKTQYSWTLKNSQGTIVNSYTGSSSYNVHVPAGEYTVNCQIKDLITNEIVTLTPHPLNVKPAYMQLFGSWGNAPAVAEVGSIFIPFSASGGGGSQYYSYEWKLLLGNEEHLILNDVGGAFAQFLVPGNYLITCKVRDNLYNNEETFSHHIKIVREMVEFSNTKYPSSALTSNILLKSSSGLKFRIGDSGSYIPVNSFVTLKISHNNGQTLLNERIVKADIGKTFTLDNIPAGTLSVVMNMDTQYDTVIRIALHMELLNSTSEKKIGDNNLIYYPNSY